MLYNLEQLETLIMNLLDYILHENLLKQKCEAFLASVSFMAFIKSQIATIDPELFLILPVCLDSEFTLFETIYLVLTLLSGI